MEDKVKDEILEAIGTFSTHVDEQFSDIRSNITDIRSDITDIRSEIATKKDLGRLNYSLKTYIEEKMGEYHSDVFKRMEKEFQEDRHFQKKVIELLRANNIGTTEDWAYLEGLAKS